MKKLFDRTKCYRLPALLLCALLMGTLLMGCEPEKRLEETADESGCSEKAPAWSKPAPLCTVGEPQDDQEVKAYKPVLYLYPESAVDVSVKLNFAGKLTVTAPLYKDSWKVTAYPNGRLTADDGQVYPYLFWEGVTHYTPDRSAGYCVAGSEAGAFLAEELPKWGLNEAEAEEFIEFWQPIIAANAYHIVTFNDPNYFDLADYEIEPAPDQFIRLFMTLIPIDEPVELPSPTLPSAEAIVREGFTAVEWGGALVK